MERKKKRLNTDCGSCLSKLLSKLKTIFVTHVTTSYSEMQAN